MQNCERSFAADYYCKRSLAADELWKIAPKDAPTSKLLAGAYCLLGVLI
jgi:hypothetical protein